MPLKNVRKCITYVPNVSDSIKKVLNSTAPNIQICYRPHSKQRSSVFSQLKTKHKLGEKTNVVYHFPCLGKDNEKCDRSYVGQTKNHLHARLSQHDRDLMFVAHTEKTGKTAVVQHFEQTGHRPDLKNARVLDNEPILSKRLTLEALHIQNNHTYNLRCDTEQISGSYCALIKQQQQQQQQHKSSRLHRLHT